MSRQESIPQAPSLAKILLATVVAFIVASIILVVAVLPAEYGIDPLGTGKALGLMDLAKAGEQLRFSCRRQRVTRQRTRTPSSPNRLATRSIRVK